MTISCASPDTTLGVAVRLSTYADCQARALGENGFQALVGGPLATGLLSGLVTIFVALIGYRMILGETPGIRDGVGWAVRLGVVLTLVTGWPAFQTLFYQVAVDGPTELANLILPATGLPSQALDGRIQQAYDTIRLGSSPEQAASMAGRRQGFGTIPQVQNSGPQQTESLRSFGQAPLPQIASLFVISTVGIVVAFRFAVGFLLSIAPLAFLGLLFNATFGVFDGWVRALTGVVVGTVAALIVTSLDIVVVESELGHLQSMLDRSSASTIDPQALTTIVVMFGLVMLIFVFASLRMTGGFRLPTAILRTARIGQGPSGAAAANSYSATGTGRSIERNMSDIAGQTRVNAVAGALALTVRREQAVLAGSGGPDSLARNVSIVEAAEASLTKMRTPPLGVAGKRSTGRRTRSTMARDKTA